MEKHRKSPLKEGVTVYVSDADAAYKQNTWRGDMFRLKYTQSLDRLLIYLLNSVEKNMNMRGREQCFDPETKWNTTQC